MIKSKKLLAILTVLTVIVSMLGGLTASAATIPTANLTMTYNETESTTSKIVIDVTTTAEYVNAASIVWDISPIWTSISGAAFTQKGNTISSGSTFGTGIQTNKDEYGSTAKFACMASKKLKIQLASSTSALPFDMTGSNIIAKIVIPLTTPLTADVTLALDEASTYLDVGVLSDDPNSVTGYEYAQQYVNTGALAVNTKSVVAKGPAASDPKVTVAKDAQSTPALRVWNVWVADCSKAVVATLTKGTETVGPKTIEGPAFSGGGEMSFNVYTRVNNAANQSAAINLKVEHDGESANADN